MLSFKLARIASLITYILLFTFVVQIAGAPEPARGVVHKAPNVNKECKIIFDLSEVNRRSIQFQEGKTFEKIQSGVYNLKNRKGEIKWHFQLARLNIQSFAHRKLPYVIEIKTMRSGPPIYISTMSGDYCNWSPYESQLVAFLPLESVILYPATNLLN